jgi:hypothetical protein
MTKDEMTILLRSVGSNEHIIENMELAFDMGADWAKDAATDRILLSTSENSSVGRDFYIDIIKRTNT